MSYLYNSNSIPRLISSIRERNYVNTTISGIKNLKAGELPLILRGDVEYDPKNCLVFASILTRLGLKASFYFRGDTAFNEELIGKVSSLGHEVGLHCNALDRAQGDFELARRIFIEDINKFRNAGIKLLTVVNHSELLLRKNGYCWDEDMFRRFPSLLEELGLEEAYEIYSRRDMYNSGSALPVTFVGDNISQVVKLESAIRNSSKTIGLHILFHPHRWRSSLAQSMFWVFRDLCTASLNILNLRHMKN